MAALDAMRFFASLWVVTFHYVGVGSSAWGRPTWVTFPLLQEVARYGWLGVQLFFLISGFVICMSAWDRGVDDFAISRITRLFPAYWFAIFFTTVTLMLLPQSGPQLPLSDILINLTMLQTPFGVAHVDLAYWSLWQELLFYLIFSVVVWRGLTYRRVVIFCVLWLVAAAIAPRSGVPLLVTLAQPDFAMFFIAGIVMHLMHRFRPNLMLWGMLAGCFLLSTKPIMEQVRTWDPKNGPGPTWWGVIGLEVAIFATILFIALRPWRLRWRWVTAAGAMSYPLYLLHQLIGLRVIETLRDRLPAPALLAGLISTMLLVSWLVQRLIERPVARWLRPRLVAAMADVRGWSPPGRATVPRPRPAPPEPPGPAIDPVPAPASRTAPW